MTPPAVNGNTEVFPIFSNGQLRTALVFPSFDEAWKVRAEGDVAIGAQDARGNPKF